MPLVSIDNFDAKRLSIGKIEQRLTPVKYVTVPILYNDDSGVAGNLLLLTPILHSKGVYKTTEPNTEKIKGYSMTFHAYNKNEGIQKDEARFQKVIEDIEAFCKKALADNETEISKKKGKPLTNQPPLIFKYMSDEEGNKVGPPMIWAKMYVDAKMNITSDFFRKKTKKDNEKHVVGKNKVCADPFDYLQTPCTAIGCLRIESIFVGNIGEFIQVRLKEAVVVKKLSTVKSIIGADLGPEESGSESEDELGKKKGDDAKEDVDAPKTKREILVRPGQKRHIQEQDFDDEDDDDGVVEALKAAIKRR